MFCLINCCLLIFVRNTNYKRSKIKEALYRSYLKGFLVPDVLSSLPYDHMTLPWRRLPGDNPYYIVILLNLMPAMKLTRYYTLHLNIQYLFTVMFSLIFCCTYNDDILLNTFYFSAS